MTTQYLVEEKIRARVAELAELVVRDRVRARVDFDASAWRALEVGDGWGGSDAVTWFRARVDVPPQWRVGGRANARESLIGLRIRLSDRARTEPGGPEGLLYVNGAPISGLDANHTEIVLTPALIAQAGAGDAQSLVFAVRATCGPSGAAHAFGGAELVLVDRDAEALRWSLEAGIEAVRVLGAASPERVALLDAMDDAVQCIDWRDPGSDEFYASVSRARARLAERLASLPAGAMRPRIVCAGHSHIDVAWLWPLRHTREKCARTFATAVHLMDLYPEYCLIQSQPQLYEFVKESYPEIFARIKEKAASGQWEPTGGMWVEPDCNVTSGESLVRQLLFGTRFFRREFGRECKVLWLPDTFGFSWVLPQLMRRSGLEYFVTAKLSWNQYDRPQYDTFVWRGADGSEVLAHLLTTPAMGEGGIGNTYSAEISPASLQATWDNYRQKAINDELLAAFGFGDGGGGPTRDMLEMARRLRDMPGIPRAEVGRVEPFLERLAARVKDHPHLPVWDGELYFECHRGTYTSQARNKRANRLSEILYHDAEAFSCLASAADPEFRYPQDDMNRGWKLILLNQFHDILPGSSVREVYEDSARDYEEIARLGSGALDCALRRIASRIRLRSAPALVVFNSLPWDRADLVEIPWDPAFEGKRLVDSGGREVASQLVRESTAQGGGGRKTLLLYVEGVPAFGYKALYLEDAGTCAASAPAAPSSGGGAASVHVTPTRIENGFFAVTLNAAGQIASVRDKRLDREVLPQGARANVLQVFEDRPLRFDAWDIDIFYRDKMWEVDDLQEATVEESGPERGVLKLVWRFMDSLITQRLVLYRAIPRIDFRTELEWRGRQLLLKAAFPVDVRSTKATYDIQFGNIERPTHWNTSWDYARFEVCAHKWADLSEGGYGVSLLNDCKYGHDVKDNVMRITLVKSAVSPDPAADKGRHEFTYSLYPHAGGWYAGGTARQAYQLNYPLRAVVAGAADPAGGPGYPSEGVLPDALSFVRADAPNVIVETLKKAEDSDAAVVRVYEYGGMRGPVSLDFAFPVRAARECDLMERAAGPVESSGRGLRFFIKPYEIRTFLVELGEV